MGVLEILTQIDHEISRLQEARALLVKSGLATSRSTVKKRNLTPEGRKRISEAVKRRWAVQKKNKVFEPANNGWVTEGLVGS